MRGGNMPRRIFSFDPPDRFVAGAVGRPGQRTFFLQASRGEQIVSVALEKAQVAVLAERVATLLLALRQRGVDVGDEPPTRTVALAEPVVEEFRVGTLTLGWDPERERVVIEARQMGEDEEEDDDEDEDDEEAEASEEEVSAGQVAGESLREAMARLGGAEDGPSTADLDLVRVQLEPTAALEFAAGAVAVVQAGRPPCPNCGEPLEPTGHFCARRNEYTH
jgi:uncharacterized repeat protein (TIGR03847 family)